MKSLAIKYSNLLPSVLRSILQENNNLNKSNLEINSNSSENNLLDISNTSDNNLSVLFDIKEVAIDSDGIDTWGRLKNVVDNTNNNKSSSINTSKGIIHRNNIKFRKDNEKLENDYLPLLK